MKKLYLADARPNPNPNRAAATSLTLLRLDLIQTLAAAHFARSVCLFMSTRFSRYLDNKYDFYSGDSWSHWSRDRVADYVRRKEHWAPRAKKILEAVVSGRKAGDALQKMHLRKRHHNEIGDAEIKHGHHASYEDGTNHEGVHNDKGEVYIIENSNVITTNKKGACWIVDWHDRRELLHRLLLPPIWAAAGRLETALAAVAGQQTVAEYTWCTQTDLQNMFGSLNNVQQNGKDTDGYLPFYPVNYSGNGFGAASTADQVNQYLPLCQKQYVFHNSSQANVQIEILDFQAKQDNDVGPQSMWANAYTVYNEQPSGVAGPVATDTLAYADIAAGGAFAALGADYSFNQSIATLGQRPWKSKMLKHYWHLMDKVTASIPPGRSLEYTVNITRQKITKYELTNARSNIHGFTRKLLVIIHGQLDSASSTAGVTTVSNASLNVRTQAQYACYNFLNIPTRKWTGGLTADANDTNNWYPTIATTANNKTINQDTDEVLMGNNAYA